MRPLFPAVVTGLLVVYAFVRRALTPGGICAAILTAILTAFHPWGVFFTQLITFFLAGTLITKLAHARKAALVAPSQKQSAKAEPRNALQVFCNSLPMTVLSAAHGLYMHFRLADSPDFMIAMPPNTPYDPFWFPPVCLSRPTSSEIGRNEYVRDTEFYIPFMNTLPYAVMAGYAAVAADTFASEIGMLAGSRPFLVTSLLKGRIQRVPPGTNGGVTVEGLLASAVGAALMAVAALYTVPLCEGRGSLNIVETRAAFFGAYLGEGLGDLKRWNSEDRTWFVVYLTVAGVVGALFDSVVGAIYQASVVDSRGRIVEGEGGRKVGKQAERSSYKLVSGIDKLSNNAVNLVMASGVCLATVVVMRIVTL